MNTKQSEEIIKELYEKVKGCIDIAYFENKINIKARDYIYKLLSLMILDFSKEIET